MPSANGQAHAPLVREYGRSKFIALLLVVVNEAISISMLYPYVGLLIVHLDPAMSRKDAGTLSGLVVGVFNIAQAIFAQRWGRLSDRYGRRPLLILGLFGSAVFAVLFGLSGNVWQLLLFRFLHGAANGNAPLAKTMTAEMTTSATDAYGWAMMSAGWAIGSTVGPTLGGLLYDPAGHWPGVFGGTVFELRPALLPGLFGALYSFFAIGVVRFVLPESNPNARPPQWLKRIVDGNASGASWGRRGGGGADDDDDGDGAELTVCGQRPSAARQVAVGSRGADDDDDDYEENVPLTSGTPPDTPAMRAGPRTTAVPNYGIHEMLSSGTMRRVLFMYVMLAWANTAFNETFPLLGITPVPQGGLGLDASEIGFAFTAFAAFNMMSTACFPSIVAVTGRLQLARWGLVILGVSMLMHAALPAIHWDCDAAKAVAASALMSFPRVWVANFCFSISTMGIAAAAPRDHLGAATGLSHSCGNLARALLPPVVTWLFAWSIRVSVDGDDLASVAQIPQHGEHLVAVTAPPAGANRSACQGDPQTLLGPLFPANRWFSFLLLCGSAVLTALATVGMREPQFIRASAASMADSDDDEARPLADDEPVGRSTAAAADSRSGGRGSPEPTRPPNISFDSTGLEEGESPSF